MKKFISRSRSPSGRDGSQAGFTLTELLVVLGLLALLATTQLPALSRAKPKSQTARCASNMRVWGIATAMYLGDNNDHLPYYALQFASQATEPYLFETLAPYVGKVTTPAANSTVARAEIRKCPAGSFFAPPFYTGLWSPTTNSWNCWIGANFGTYASALNGAFYYANDAFGFHPPLNVSRIKKPADALIFMDTDGQYLYSPVLRPFTYDCDGDGLGDSYPAYAPYNHARPTVHDNGANVTLMDGHVERVSFNRLWQVAEAGKVVHSFWYLED